MPHLQLIHCLVDDDTLKVAYLQRNDIDDSRITLDNRNSDMQEPTVFELIADWWKDPTFQPETEALPCLHPDSKFSEILTFDLVADLATATSQRVKDKLQSLNVALTWVITMWQQSGQGDGGRLVDDDSDHNVDSKFRESSHPEFRCYQSRSQRLYCQLKSIKRLPWNVDDHLVHHHKNSNHNFITKPQI